MNANYTNDWNEFQKNPQLIDYLRPYDRFWLLPELNDEKFLENNIEDEEDIFELKHVDGYVSERAKADLVAQRVPCKNFDEFEWKFYDCHRKLERGEYVLIDYKEQNLLEWAFGVLNGVMFYIAKIEEWVRGNSGKINRRTLVIFENGTQSRMLHRSLGKAMWWWQRGAQKWKMVVVNDENVKENIDWYIYVLSSLSSDTRIIDIKNLYKIGFSTTSVEDRIKNAEKEPTYLMSPVKIEAKYEVSGVNPIEIEKLIHKFFANVCLDFIVTDNNGIIHKPEEWFIVSMDVIDEFIELLSSGEIINYIYDKNLQKIIKKHK